MAIYNIPKPCVKDRIAQVPELNPIDSLRDVFSAFTHNILPKLKNPLKMSGFFH